MATCLACLCVPRKPHEPLTRDAPRAQCFSLSSKLPLLQVASPPIPHLHAASAINVLCNNGVLVDAVMMILVRPVVLSTILRVCVLFSQVVEEKTTSHCKQQHVRIAHHCQQHTSQTSHAHCNVRIAHPVSAPLTADNTQRIAM